MIVLFLKVEKHDHEPSENTIKKYGPEREKSFVIENFGTNGHTSIVRFCGMEPPFRLSIYIPDVCIKTVMVTGSQRISELEKSLPQGRCSLLHAGKILFPGQTFSFYNLSNGDSIVAIDQSREKELTRWVRLTESDREDFDLKVKLLTNDNARASVLRRIDVAALREELHAKRWRRQLKIAKAREDQEIGFNRAYQQQMVIPDKLSQCCEELPAFWV